MIDLKKFKIHLLIYFFINLLIINKIKINLKLLIKNKYKIIIKIFQKKKLRYIMTIKQNKSVIIRQI